MDEDVTWYGHVVLDGVPAPVKGAQQPPFFSAYVYCGHGRPSQHCAGTDEEL